MIYETFLQSPIFVFNFWVAENLLFYFDISGTLQNSKGSEIFTALIFLHEEQLEHKKHTREAMRPKQDMVAWA
jgi:hypothetical protein